MNNKKLLINMKDDLEKYAEILAGIMPLDVSIVDMDMFSLLQTGDTSDTYEPANPAHVYLVEEVLASGEKAQLFMDPKDNPSCAGCSHKAECKLRCLGVAPLSAFDEPIGIILLAATTKKQEDYCRKNRENLVSFLVNTAQLISSKAELISEYETQNNMAYLLRYCMDQIEEGIVVLDKRGHASHINHAALLALDIAPAEKHFHVSDIIVREGKKLRGTVSEFTVTMPGGKQTVRGQSFSLGSDLWSRIVIMGKPDSLPDPGSDSPGKYSIKHMEQDAIRDAVRELTSQGYSRKQIAQELGISVATLYRRLKTLGISK